MSCLYQDTENWMSNENLKHLPHYMKHGVGEFLVKFVKNVGVHRIPGHPCNWILNVETSLGSTLEYYWISIRICEMPSILDKIIGSLLRAWSWKKLVCQVA